MKREDKTSKSAYNSNAKLKNSNKCGNEFFIIWFFGGIVDLHEFELLCNGGFHQRGFQQTIGAKFCSITQILIIVGQCNQ